MWAATLPLTHTGLCNSAHTDRACSHSTPRCRRRPLHCSCLWGASDSAAESVLQRRSALLAALAAAFSVQCAGPVQAAVPGAVQDGFRASSL